MALWTDLISPAELTGFARAAAADIDADANSLAAWLPNVPHDDISVRITKGEGSLQVSEAKYRAYDAELEFDGGETAESFLVELPALGQIRPVSEYKQLRIRNASDDAVRRAVEREVRKAVKATIDRANRLRGQTLYTGKATINQPNFKSDDDFGRAANHSQTAANLWDGAGANPLSDMTAWNDIYGETNGQSAGVILVSSRVLRVIANHDTFAVTGANGATRPAPIDEINAILAAHNLPRLVVNDARTSQGRIIPDTGLLFLPDPFLSTEAEEPTDLGATLWGLTLAATDADYEIEEAELPGIVASVHKGDLPPHIATAVADAISLPVLVNPNLTLQGTVLS
ncbi:major capsid protein [Zhihengliuella flava]|uniref:Major capsid protein E n=1 Tax=Zhihengliuella flava TaxID=1285193 RepID=A0A931D6B8_9MICC|nr:major capsid protein [Zhihengliuella flava]MBG6083244.1 hypothetical protein [Zhihengliuella flava]